MFLFSEYFAYFLYKSTHTAIRHGRELSRKEATENSEKFTGGQTKSNAETKKKKPVDIFMGLKQPVELLFCQYHTKKIPKGP